MAKKNEEELEVVTVNPLKNEQVTYKYVPRITGTTMDNPKHVNSGGFSENAVYSVCLPEVGRNVYKKIFTYEEQAFLEKMLHLEEGKLSTYSNYWEDFRVNLQKAGKTLNLLEPMDLIQDRVLLANDSYIAPSLADLNDPLKTKATYRFVRTNFKDEGIAAKKKISTKSKAYITYGKIENDWDKLYYVAKHVDSKSISQVSNLEDLQGIVAALIETKADSVLLHTEDMFFDTKVIIDKAVRLGVIEILSSELYLDKTKITETNVKGDMNNTAIFLNKIENQEKKLLILAKIDKISKENK